MSIILLFMTDGRDELLERTIASAEERLIGPITRRVIHTDKSNLHRHALRERYPDFEIIGGPRKGFGGAIRRAWSYCETRNEDFVFHCEDDFTFNYDIALDEMAAVLNTYPYLTQMALVRQAWNADEYRAGGLIRLHIDSMTQVKDQRMGVTWLEHRLWVTSNPALWPMRRIREGWPDVPFSEGVYSIEAFKDPAVYSGYWGGFTDSPWVHHIGEQRVGRGY